jgi:hypothetical protein
VRSRRRLLRPGGDLLPEEVPPAALPSPDVLRAALRAGDLRAGHLLPGNVQAAALPQALPSAHLLPGSDLRAEDLRAGRGLQAGHL